MKPRPPSALTTALVLTLATAAPALAGGLREYVDRPDASYAWNATRTQDWPGGRATYFEFTSQTWRGIPWAHQLQVYTPDQVEHPGHVLLFITGGNSRSGPPGAGQAAQYLSIAKACGARVAVLPQVPNQPLLGDRYEDDLIAETFTQFLKTGEDDWPLLFPMVKSAVKAMDAVQEWAKEEGEPAEKFVVTGASKRGWTTWLTGATDPRVVAIAPMVIPTLNMRAQTKYQRESFGGEYSEQIADYSERGLTEIFGSPEGEELTKLIDPFYYLDRIKVPVLQLHGTNDPYWTVDSMNLFWDDIQAPKSVVYVPNAGHGLDKSEFVVPYVINTLGAFFRHAAKDEAMPKVSWSYKETDETVTLSITQALIGSVDVPKGIKLWTTEAETKDFRKAPWTASEPTDPRELSGGSGHTSMTVDRPAKGYKAVFADLTYEYAGLEYHLSTQIHVLGPKPDGE